MRKKIYKIVDTFLIEAQNKDGEYRTLRKLNEDRKLAVDNFEKLIFYVLEETKTDLLAIADAGEYEDMRREVENYFNGKNKGEPAHNDKPTYYRTIVNSGIWKEWAKYNEESLEWDIHESIETDQISPNHWEAFIVWVQMRYLTRLKAEIENI